jgi:hypothetical protein
VYGLPTLRKAFRRKTTEIPGCYPLLDLGCSFLSKSHRYQASSSTPYPLFGAERKSDLSIPSAKPPKLQGYRYDDRHHRNGRSSLSGGERYHSYITPHLADEARYFATIYVLFSMPKRSQRTSFTRYIRNSIRTIRLYEFCPKKGFPRHGMSPAPTTSTCPFSRMKERAV